MNSLINTVGGIIRLIFSVVTVPILLRILGINIFAQYSLVNAVINIFSLAEWSIAMTATVFLSKVIETSPNINKEYERLISSISIIMILAVILVLIIFTQFKSSISFFIGSDKNSTLNINNLSVILAINLCLRIIQQFFVGVEQAHKMYKLSNLLISLNSLVASIVTIACAYRWHSINLIILSQSIVIGFFVLIHWTLCVKNNLIKIKYFFVFSIAHIKTVGFYSVRTWFGAFGGILFLQGDKIIINKLLGLEVTGIYAALTGISNQINAVSALPLQPIVPEVSRFIKSEKLYITKTELVKVLQKAFLMNITLIVILASTIVFFSPEIVVLLGVKSFLFNQEVSKLLVIITIIYALYSLNALGYYCLYATNNETYVAVVTLFSSLLSLALITVLSKEYGPIGAFLGNSGFLVTLVFIWKSLKVLDVKFEIVIQRQLLIFLAFVVSVIVFSLNLNFNARLVIYVCLMVVSLIWLNKHAGLYKIILKKISTK